MKNQATTNAVKNAIEMLIILFMSCHFFRYAVQLQKDHLEKTEQNENRNAHNEVVPVQLNISYI